VKETVEVMEELKARWGGSLEVHVYLSKAGAQVAKYYGLDERLRAFDSLHTEKDANTPFLAGQLQLGRFKALLVAPATGNTVAKLAAGIADTLVTNAAIQAVKGFVDVFVMPVDLHEGEVETTLPSGRTLRLRVRREDAENARRLAAMEGFHVFGEPREIRGVVEGLMGG